MGWNNEGRQNNQGSRGQGNGRGSSEGETKDYKWTELGSLWEGKDGMLSGRCHDPSKEGEGAIHEHRRLGYKLAAIARGDRIVIMRNKDKERENQPHFKLLLVKDDGEGNDVPN